MDVLSVTFLASCESEREWNLHRAVMELFLRQSLQTSGLCLTVSWTDNTSQLRRSAGSAHCQSQRQLCIPTSAKQILRQNSEYNRSLAEPLNIVFVCVLRDYVDISRQSVFKRCICSLLRAVLILNFFLLFPLRYSVNMSLNLFSQYE